MQRGGLAELILELAASQIASSIGLVTTLSGTSLQRVSATGYCCLTVRKQCANLQFLVFIVFFEV